MPKWNDEAVRHVRTSNDARGIERTTKKAFSALWDRDVFEGNFWDYSGASAGWQVNAVNLGDPTLSMGMVDEDGRYAWSVKDYLGKEVASGAARELSSALDDAEMAYRISSDDEMDFLAKRTAMQEVLSADRAAANISPGDVNHLGEGWYQYESSDGTSQLTLIERDNDEWECEVAWSDGRVEDIVLNSWNDVDALAAGVEFYNRVAAYAPDSQEPVDTGDGNPGTVTVDDASEDNDPQLASRTASAYAAKDALEDLIDALNYDENDDGATFAEQAESFMHQNDWDAALGAVDRILLDGLSQDAKMYLDRFIDEAEDALDAGQTVSNRTAARKTALSMWDEMSAPAHKVAGWNWDNHLEGFIAEGASAHFACICGSNVEAPGYTTCACGKIWNSYPITSEGATKVFCREVPNRGADVLLANRTTRTL